MLFRSVEKLTCQARSACDETACRSTLATWKSRRAGRKVRIFETVATAPGDFRVLVPTLRVGMPAGPLRGPNREGGRAERLRGQEDDCRWWLIGNRTTGRERGSDPCENDPDRTRPRPSSGTSRGSGKVAPSA